MTNNLVIFEKTLEMIEYGTIALRVPRSVAVTSVATAGNNFKNARG